MLLGTYSTVTMLFGPNECLETYAKMLFHIGLRGSNDLARKNTNTCLGNSQSGQLSAPCFIRPALP